MEAKAKRLGATEFGMSEAKDKRYYVIYGGHKINFGSKRGQAFIDHKDNKKRKAWRARHSKIKNKNGQAVIDLKTSPSYWAAQLLW